MIIRLYEENPNQKQLLQVVNVLKKGGIVIYPTDTIYAMGCAVNNTRGMEKIAQIRGVTKKEHDFSLICYDLSQLSSFTKPIPNNIFKLMKKNLPGQFTFILNANNNVPKIFKQKKKTIGIRIPDNHIIRSIAELLEAPIATASIRDEDSFIEYTTDPELIYERYENQVDLMVNGGYGNNVASTIVDCTSGTEEITRQGAGELIY